MDGVGVVVPGLAQLRMLARPEVKRTYSRIKPIEQTDNIDFDYERNESITDNIKNERDIVKTPKMKKITDFFKVYNSKRSDENENLLLQKGKLTIKSPENDPINLHTRDRRVQTFLDLGQKDIFSSQCPECLMHYNKSFVDDVNSHKKFHAQFLKGFTFSFDEKDRNVREVAPRDLLKWSKYRFYEISEFRRQNHRLLKRIEFFMNFVHVQLGSEPLSLDELTRMEGRYSAILVTDSVTTKIIGFVLFESCRRVFKSLLGCDASAIELEPVEIENQLAQNESLIGVSRIWTDPKHRNRGLASTMLDLKCSERRHMIAFSQPTPMGFSFAKAYQRSGQCLIYLE